MRLQRGQTHKGLFVVLQTRYPPGTKGFSYEMAVTIPIETPAAIGQIVAGDRFNRDIDGLVPFALMLNAPERPPPQDIGQRRAVPCTP